MREGDGKLKRGRSSEKKKTRRRISLGSLPGGEQRSEEHHQVFNTAGCRNIIPVCDSFRLSCIYLSFYTLLDNDILQRH